MDDVVELARLLKPLADKYPVKGSKPSPELVQQLDFQNPDGSITQYMIQFALYHVKQRKFYSLSIKPTPDEVVQAYLMYFFFEQNPQNKPFRVPNQNAVSFAQEKLERNLP